MNTMTGLGIVAGCFARIVALAIWNFKGLPGIFKAYLEFSRPNWNLQQFNRRSMVPDKNCNNYMVDKIYCALRGVWRGRWGSCETLLLAVLN